MGMTVTETGSQEPQGAQGNQQDVASEDERAQEGGDSHAGKPQVADLSLDPLGEVGGAGVDAWELAAAAAEVPAHHPHLDPGLVHLANQGAARGVLRAGGEEGRRQEAALFARLGLCCPQE